MYKKVNKQKNPEVAEIIKKNRQKDRRETEQANRGYPSIFFHGTFNILKACVRFVKNSINYLLPSKKIAEVSHKIDSIKYKKNDDKQERINLFTLQEEAKSYFEVVKTKVDPVTYFVSLYVLQYLIIPILFTSDIKLVDFEEDILKSGSIAALAYLLQPILNTLFPHEIHKIQEFKAIDPFATDCSGVQLKQSIESIRENVSFNKNLYYIYQFAMCSMMTLMVANFLYSNKFDGFDWNYFLGSVVLNHRAILDVAKNVRKKCLKWFGYSSQGFYSTEIKNYHNQLNEFGQKTGLFTISDNGFNDIIPDSRLNEYVFQGQTLLSHYFILKVSNSKQDKNNLIYFLKKLGGRVELVADDQIVVKIVKNEMYKMESLIEELKAREENLRKLTDLSEIIENNFSVLFENYPKIKFDTYIQNAQEKPFIKLTVF